MWLLQSSQYNIYNYKNSLYKNYMGLSHILVNFTIHKMMAKSAQTLYTC